MVGIAKKMETKAMKQRERASVLVINQRKILLVRLKDPSLGKSYLFPPGGGIEAGETPSTAAEREAKEETGYTIEVMAESEFVAEYPFTWNKEEFLCKTHFFRARLVDTKPVPVQPDPIHEGVVWQPLATLETALTYEGPLKQAILSALGTRMP